MTVNTPLLRKVLNFVTDHPDEWNQGVWAVRSACGTTACIAGHTVLMTGHEVEWGPSLVHDVEHDVEKAVAVLGEPWTPVQTIREVATRELGLTEDQAYLLFNAGNTLADLWWLAGKFTDWQIAMPVGIDEDPAVYAVVRQRWADMTAQELVDAAHNRPGRSDVS